MTGFNEKVWACVKHIPRGKVATYASIARKIGHPRSARAVGNALNKNLYRHPGLAKLVPCHRVIRSDGSVGGFVRGTNVKINLLQKEGIKITNNKVERKYILEIRN